MNAGLTNSLVLGLGESGLAMALWLHRQGRAVRVADSRDDPPGVAELKQHVPDAECICGPFSFSLLKDIDQLAISPGLSVDTPIVQEALKRGIDIVGEIELFARALPSLPKAARILAITGTNGKTTTTTLTGALCRAAGLETAIAGNISPSALTELMRRIDENQLPDVWVLELSSFQLETTRSLRCDAATVLNISDDHLDRHGSMERYAEIKSRLLAQAGAQVINRDDPMVRDMASSDRVFASFGLGQENDPKDYGVCSINHEYWLSLGREPLLPVSKLRLAGQHNVANALAALALCEAIALPRGPLLQALENFRGLRHRVELFARRDDAVEFFDDSKGTNVGATVAAVCGLGRPVVLIAGGDGKGQDFAPLLPAISQHARAVVLIGRDASLIAAAISPANVECVFASDMSSAVEKAATLAQAGDAVLLSPACASFDMYRNYAHRAEVFCQAVLRVKGVTTV